MRGMPRISSRMSSTDPRLASFLNRCDLVAKRLQISRARLSTRLLADGKRLDQLALGRSDIGILRLSRAERLLSALEGESPTRSAMARAAKSDRPSEAA